MSAWWDSFRKGLRRWIAVAVVAAPMWIGIAMLEGLCEGTGWGPKQVFTKLGQWLTQPSEPKKPARLETGSIPEKPAAKPEPTEAQKKKEAAAARARKARCEKERVDELVDAERELAVAEYQVAACVARTKEYIFREDPEQACKRQIDAKNASAVRRDAAVARHC